MKMSSESVLWLVVTIWVVLFVDWFCKNIQSDFCTGGDDTRHRSHAAYLSKTSKTIHSWHSTYRTWVRGPSSCIFFIGIIIETKSIAGISIWVTPTSSPGASDWHWWRWLWRETCGSRPRRILNITGWNNQQFEETSQRGSHSQSHERTYFELPFYW